MNWFILGLAIIAVYFLIWSLCAVAKRADEQSEKMFLDAALTKKGPAVDRVLEEISPELKKLGEIYGFCEKAVGFILIAMVDTERIRKYSAYRFLTMAQQAGMCKIGSRVDLYRLWVKLENAAGDTETDQRHS